MPDWIAHLMLGTTISFLLGIKEEKRVIFLIGNLMPDFAKILVLLNYILNSGVFYSIFVYPINNASHSIIGVIAISSVLSIFFENKLELSISDSLNSEYLRSKKRRHSNLIMKWQEKLRSPFVLLFLGGVLHLFLDTFMWPWAGGINWLYPIDIAPLRWSFKLVWPATFDAIIVLTPIFLLSLLLYSLNKYFKNKKDAGII
jgi:hypothetical protein